MQGKEGEPSQLQGEERLGRGQLEGCRKRSAPLYYRNTSGGINVQKAWMKGDKACNQKYQMNSSTPEELND